MSYRSASPCITTRDVAGSREFYVRHFAAAVTFDADWYATVRLGGPDGPEVSFIAPRGAGDEPFAGRGVMLNLWVDDPDAEFARLTADGLAPVLPIEDHDWGDRGFAVADPNGVVVYVYTPTEPTGAFARSASS